MTKILKASLLIDTGLEQAQADELQSRFMAVAQSLASLCYLRGRPSASPDAVANTVVLGKQ